MRGWSAGSRNHTPRRESWRRDSFLVTLRCLTGPMTSGRAMMEELDERNTPTALRGSILSTYDGYL